MSLGVRPLMEREESGKFRPLCEETGPPSRTLQTTSPFVDALDPQPDQAVVYEEAVARPHVVDEPVVGGREPARVADEVPRGDDDLVALDQARAALDLAGPDLRPLQVLHHGHVAPELLGRGAHDLGVVQVHVVVAVAEVEPGHVYPDPDQGLYALPRGGRGPERRDDLGPAHRQIPSPALTLGLNAIRPG